MLLSIQPFEFFISPDNWNAIDSVKRSGLSVLPHCIKLYLHHKKSNRERMLKPYMHF